MCRCWDGVGSSAPFWGWVSWSRPDYPCPTSSDLPSANTSTTPPHRTWCWLWNTARWTLPLIGQSFLSTSLLNGCGFSWPLQWVCHDSAVYLLLYLHHALRIITPSISCWLAHLSKWRIFRLCTLLALRILYNSICYLYLYSCSCCTGAMDHIYTISRTPRQLWRLQNSST